MKQIKSEWKKAEQNFFKNLLPGDSGKVLVDLGCGDTPFEFLLKYDYIGFDTRSTRYGKLIDITKPLPLKDSIADIVTAFDVFEHLNEPRECVKEAYRILKLGGMFTGAVPFKHPIHDKPDYFRYTDQGLAYLLKDFKEIKIEPLGSPRQVLTETIRRYCGLARKQGKGFLIRKILRLILPVAPYLEIDTKVPHGYTFIARK